MRKSLSRLVTILLILSLAACYGGGGQPLSAPDRIVIGRTSDADYLDPWAETIGGAEANVLNQIYEGLVRNAPDGSAIVPWLAERWEISEDGRTYTFWLRPGIRFSDGQPVTADDWVWSLTRAKETTTSAYQYLAEPIERVEALSDNEISITLSQPTAGFLAALCSFNMVVASRRHYEAVGPEEFLRSPMGTGPYRLKEWRTGESLILEANSHYHQEGLPLTPELQFMVVSDDNTRLLQLQAGQLDLGGDMPFTMAEQIAADQRLELEVFPSTRICHLLLNTTNPPFDDPAARRALRAAIDKEELAEIVTAGLGVAASSIVSESMGKWHNGSLLAQSGDPDGAKAALAAAGYTEDIPFTLTVTAGHQVYEQTAVLLQSQLNRAGFAVTIEQLESGAQQDLYHSLNHQATLLQWFDDIPDPSGAVGWTCDYAMSKAWYTGLHDRELEALSKAAAGEMDEDTRVQMYHEIQRRIHENANVIPLFQGGYAHARRADLHSLFVDPFNVYRAERLYKEPPDEGQ